MRTNMIGLATAALMISTGMAAAEVTYAPGLEAEIYVVGRVGEVRELPNRPSGVPLGIVLDRNAPLLDYNVFQRDEAIRTYYGQNFLGILWKGYLDIKEEGNHIFSISDFMPHYRSGCVVNSWINGQPLLSVSHMGGGSDRSHTDQNVYDLQPGLYEVSIWKVCGNDRNGVISTSDIDRVRLTFLMKTPAQQRIEPIDSALLVHQAR